MENKIIGPALPPHLFNRVSSLKEVSGGSSRNEELPCSSVSNEESAFHNECDMYGPALPPHLREKSGETSKQGVVGPCLPSGVLSHSSDPPDEDCTYPEDDNDFVGPPMPDCGTEPGAMTLNQQKLEMRARYLKRKMAEQESGGEKHIAERETWMLELPPEKAVNLGLGPRSFRQREAPDMRDRSDWTDTPADRERKQIKGGANFKDSSEDLMKTSIIKERDKVMERMAESCKDEKRQLSLLEMHQKERLKKLKKEKKERGDKAPERRPFDRNIDLQANRFDEAQKKSIMKKAQLLDSRFSSGQSKYL